MHVCVCVNECAKEATQVCMCGLEFLMIYDLCLVVNLERKISVRGQKK